MTDVRQTDRFSRGSIVESMYWMVLRRPSEPAALIRSTLLMEAGVSYNKQKLHKAGYFRELLATNSDIDESLRALLRQCREMVVRLGKMESALIHSLQQDRLLVERVERLMSPTVCTGDVSKFLRYGRMRRLSSAP